MAALSLQGPKSRTILNLACEQPVDALKYFRMAYNRIDEQVPSRSRAPVTPAISATKSGWMPPMRSRSGTR